MPLADFASSAESFADAAAQFFGHLSDIHWTPFALALGCLAAMQLARAWAWRNSLSSEARSWFVSPTATSPGRTTVSVRSSGAAVIGPASATSGTLTTNSFSSHS